MDTRLPGKHSAVLTRDLQGLFTLAQEFQFPRQLLKSGMLENVGQQLRSVNVEHHVGILPILSRT